MNIKLIAFYLPQFHEIPENNEWWGQGFTEWERVKNAKPLFPGHNQPRVPYKYYDLSDIDVLREQSEMALKYGLDGFCYYHYWFNGKKLLEKPLELMLEHKDIKIPFCLSWANEPWTRAWDGKPKEVLMPQNYGAENDWLAHLEYLIPFFNDERYIKINDKPVFLVYRTESFSRFDEMFKFWNTQMKRFGLKELYLVETLNSFQKKPKCKHTEAVLEFEPMYSSGYTRYHHVNKSYTRIKKIIELIKKLIVPNTEISKLKIINYDEIWKRIINRKKNYKKNRFLGAYVGWDNTPRMKNFGTVHMGTTPIKFEKYLKIQRDKSKNNNSSLLFINAWNEWAEGAYLEPDDYFGFSFLEAIYKLKNDK